MDGVSGITVASQPTFGEIQRAVQDICGWERYYLLLILGINYHLNIIVQAED